MRRTSHLTVAATVMALSACSALGTLGNVLGSMGGGSGAGGQQQQSQIQAEVQQLDVNGQRLYVRTQDGQTGTIRFDSQTQVIYRQQQYPVTALERGDIVNIQLQQTSQNELYALRIDVVQSVR